MQRVFVLAASASALLSAPAAFAGEVTVKVAGRTTAAVHADIVKAATSVCQEDNGSTTYGADVLPYCIRDVARAAVEKVGSPTLTAYDKTQWRPNGLIKTASAR